MAEAPVIMNGRVWVDSDLYDIDRRIKQGDESGWRGDPTMHLLWHPERRMFEVWGQDRAGTRYLAASHHRCDHTLLQKLVAGDPQKNDVIGRVLEENRRHLAAEEAAHRERRMEKHEKLAWAVRQDFGHLFGGRRIQHFFPDRKAT